MQDAERLPRRAGRGRRRQYVQTLSVQDASFLHIESGNTQMHIGGVSLFAGPMPPIEDVRAMVLRKLPAVPRYRQRVRMAPFGLGRPVWVDDPHFNLDYHLRHTALPTPGGEVELRRLTGRIMAQRLDRQKPLWEMWVVEGLEDDRWALINKVHHCMVDGVSATDLLSVMLDAEADVPDAAPADGWHAAPEPGDVRILAHSLSEALKPGAIVADVVEGIRRPRHSLRGAASAASALAGAAGFLTPVKSSLSGPVGPHRRWSWAQASMADVKAIRAGLGGTVNDVVLAVIANGFRELLAGRGERLDGRTIRTMVPVSVRSQSEAGTYNNRVSAVLVALPVGIEDPLERLADLSRQMDKVKSSNQAVAGEVLTSLSGFAPSLLLALGMRAVARSSVATFETVATNVPGPQRPLFAAGRRMVASYPYVPVAGAVRIVVAIFSYDGQLTFGVTGDRDTVPDIDVLCRGIEDGVATLLAAA
jgi:WS/DGAT/MGAT family acyltransferase